MQISGSLTPVTCGAGSLWEAACHRLASGSAKATETRTDTFIKHIAEVSSGVTSNAPFPPHLFGTGEFALAEEQIVSNPYLNGTTAKLDGAVRLPQIRSSHE